ncbi:hypothetical protein [Lysobacter sp. Root96]|uniref:hypothetical protein n=1 Tax=Lysobacter sp. Root96 TaxID=1736612 RepID=UPI0006F9D09E|nr:hypothetical protein [Lysobacter sp. Root96]KRD71391.1 hypothetical protein ASE45_06165 [Lysobacter sp. Root96]
MADSTARAIPTTEGQAQVLSEPVAWRYLKPLGAGKFDWTRWLEMGEYQDVRELEGVKIQYAYDGPQPEDREAPGSFAEAFVALVSRLLRYESNARNAGRSFEADRLGQLIVDTAFVKRALDAERKADMAPASTEQAA